MCDSVVVVGDGRVLLAKNSDRDPNEAQVLEWHPRRSHPKGAKVRCTWIEIPQVAQTKAVLLSRPFWIWGAEMGANEHAVAIGNEAVFTSEPYAASGLTGMDLLRLALERAATAAEAVSVICDLLERHGQGGGCGHERRSFTYHNSFAIADPREAWILETAGRHWAVDRVSSGVRSISNGLTIPGFAARYGDRLKTAVSACRVRQALTERESAAAAPSPGALMRALRSHGHSRWPRYSPINGAMAAPCMHAGGLLAASQTTASWVSDLRADGAIHWATATAAPCTSLFKPFRVEQPTELGPVPDDRFDPRTLWWRHERLHRCAMRDPATAHELFGPERDDVERRWLNDPPTSAAAVAEADELLARWVQRARAAVHRDVRPPWVRHYWRVRDRRAGINEVPAPAAAA
ncbi:MAG: C69 family dipeptidase [Solirubrobacteraceae bacterium]